MKIQVRDLVAGFGATEVLKRVSLDIPARRVTAIIGPSGCGKSTFVRCLNRMHELVPGAFVQGQVLMDGADIYGHDPVALRRRVGMVFQKAAPFPTMSIAENVLAGLKLTKVQPSPSTLEDALRQAALWDEVKDRLGAPGTSLSGGQQQRLCIARTLAVQPEVLLMDEPCSSLDPIATARIEELIRSLAERYTIVIVTHNMQQAARISHRTAFFLAGEIVEASETSLLFSHPADPRTDDYVRGRFG